VVDGGNQIQLSPLSALVWPPATAVSDDEDIDRTGCGFDGVQTRVAGGDQSHTKRREKTKT
jgi:hypothetical protein